MATLFALGSNGSGQLGIGHKQDVSVPKQVIFHPEPSLPTISQIAAGGNHTLVLFESGELYQSGDSSTGACGRIRDSSDTTAVFRLLDLGGNTNTAPLGKIVSIAATWTASFIVVEDEDSRKTKLYSFGAGEKGELALGALPAQILRTPSPTLVPDFPPDGTSIVDISSCLAHVVVVLDNGDVYGWGNGRKGQLGDPSEIIQKPRKIAGLDFKAVRAICGREFTCIVGDASQGRIRVLGSDKWGIRSASPQNVQGWKDIQASWGNIYVLKQAGTLESWGRDDHGQMVPPDLPKVSRMAIGSEHAVCISEDDEVMSWGWGEHGNCGPNVENGDVKGRYNVIASAKHIPPDWKIAVVGAGCATSWVNITSI